jgi:chemotaxis protein CheD
MKGLTDVGALNARFARRFLHHEGIDFIGGSVGGDCGRRVQFWPVSGRARQCLMRRVDDAPPPHAATGRRMFGGDVELF